MSYYQTRTWMLLNDRQFVEDFRRDIDKMMPAVDIMNKYKISYHVYRVILRELYGRPMPPCRCK